MSRHIKSSNNTFDRESRIISLGISCIIIMLWIGGQHIGALCLLPSLFGDVIYSYCFRKYRMPISMKIMLVGYSLAFWWIWTFISTFFVPSNAPSITTNQRDHHVSSKLGVHRQLEREVEMKYEIIKAQNNVDIESKPRVVGKYFNPDESVSIPSSSLELIINAIGHLPPISFADFKFRTEDEIKAKYQTVFEELPTIKDYESRSRYIPEYKNPCWLKDGSEPVFDSNNILDKKQQRDLACLPYAYILGISLLVLMITFC